MMMTASSPQRVAWLSRVLLFATALLLSCAGGDPPGSRVTAIGAKLSTPRDIDISLSMPNGVPMRAVAVAAALGIHTDVETKLTGSVSTASGTIVAAHAASVTGDVTAIGDVTLTGGARVDGTIRATGAVLLDGGARANQVMAQQNIAATAPHWTIHRDAYLPPVIIVRGETRRLPPGSYDQILVGPGATLNLTAGTYVARQAVFFRGSRLIVDSRDGIVQLYAEDELHFRSAITSADGARPDLLLGYLGADDAVLAPGFTGAFVAPNAPVIAGACNPSRDESGESGHRDALNRGNTDVHLTGAERRAYDDHCSRAIYEAALYGSTMHVEHGVTVKARPFDWLAVVESTSSENVGLFAPVPDFANMPKLRLPRTPFDDDFSVSARIDAPSRDQGVTSTLDPTLGGSASRCPTSTPLLAA